MTSQHCTAGETVSARSAARVLVLDGSDRVLLLHGLDPDVAGTSWWFTVGGGREPGESAADAALRELAEETGIRAAPGQLRGPVWSRTAEFRFVGMTIRQHELFFVLRCSAEDLPEVSFAGFTELETRSVDCHRWWSVEELAATGETVYPTRLAELLPAVLDGPVGSDPIQIGT